MIAFVGALVVGATGAFFSDSETSTGNTFTAGAIDLTIGNDSYYTNEAGDLVSSATTSWAIGDLDGEVFFSFSDLKPGDIGEDTISINVDDNDAWACMANNITATPENGQTEPEAEDDDSDEADSGELQDELMFAAWHDDGDNVYENDERLYKLGGMNGPEIVSAQDMTGVQPLVDSTYNGFDVDNVGEPLTGGETYHIGKAWCLGDMTPTPIDQDGSTTTNPVDRGTGFDCSGASVDNKTQTDGITSNIQFYAVQSRNNDNFVCSDADFGDDNGQTPVGISVTDSWSSVDTGDGYDWFAKSKIQEPNPASDFEVQVGVGDSISTDFDQADTEYPNGDTVPFTLTYDGSGSATFTANGTSTTYPVGTDSISNIGVNVKAPSNATTGVSGLSLSTGSLGTTNVSVTNGTRNLTMSGADLDSGFTLSGDLTFDWDTLTSNGEDQKMQISVN